MEQQHQQQQHTPSYQDTPPTPSTSSSSSSTSQSSISSSSSHSHTPTTHTLLPPTPLSLTVGLEVHAQLALSTKLFSTARPPDELGNDAAPNSHVSPFDAAMPGALPRLCEEAVPAAARVGLALAADVAPIVAFDRKHYTYYDLPHGFQITQKRYPLCTNGFVDVHEDVPLPLPIEREGVADNSVLPEGARRVHVTSVQLEMDSGKTTHGKDGKTHVNLNRAGMPLVEVVTAPDATSGKEAVGVAKAIMRTLRATSSGDADMSKGRMRVDVNVAVWPPREQWLKARREGRPMSLPIAEVKNLNSFRAIRRAVECEQARLTMAWEQLNATDSQEESACDHASDSGHPPAISSVFDVEGDEVAVVLDKETRRFNPGTNSTERSRRKDTALDYRFHPEPDVVPRLVSPSDVMKWRMESAARIEAHNAQSLGGSVEAAAIKRLLIRQHARGLTPLSEAMLGRLQDEGGAAGARFFLALHGAFAALCGGPHEERAAGSVGHGCDDLALWMLSTLKGVLRRVPEIADKVSEGTDGEFAHVPPGGCPDRCAELLMLVRRGELPPAAFRGKPLGALLLSDPSVDVRTVLIEALGGASEGSDLNALWKHALSLPGVDKRIAKYARSGKRDAKSRGRLVQMLSGLCVKASNGGANPRDVVAFVEAHVDDLVD
ncbi:hypothetical protein PPROV_000289800 [Pycnococcus provasolii]|uniref:Aspartyl/Glutamyl-tRNA(Gln) amidotransferase subunit B/E catalytic domain-containing protein n=1 Tax=Pycnococcus provasolii TaxID=41880 RepID=A0A830HAL3_9CHLO|nr:hypothetical protein PPROV_000289800 [Pycnococcus provasolii]